MVTEDEAVPGRAWRALAVASAGYVLFGFNSTATNLAFGSIADTFTGASAALVSWVASGYFIASAAFLPLGGRLADRLGRRRIFNIGLVGFVLSALASAIAPTIEVLIAARVLQAISGAFVIPSSLAAVLPEFPAARRPSAVATWAAAGPLSAAVAPSAAAGVLGATSWRWVYAMSAPIAAVTLGLSFLLIRESSSDEESGERLDLFGTVLAVASVALLIVGIGQGTGWGWASPATVGTILGALGLGVFFVVRSGQHPAPLVNISLFRIPEIAVANLANFFMSLTSLSIWLIWPLFLTRIWDYSIAQVGLAITIGPIFAGPSALLGGRLADRYGQRWLMIIGSGICTLAVGWSVIRLGAEPDYLFGLMPTVAGFGFGWGMSSPSMNSWALAHSPQAFYGEINAAFNTNRNLAAAIGTAAGIAIVGSADRVDPIAAYSRANLFFTVAVGLSFVVVVIGTTILGRKPQVEDVGGSDGNEISAAELLDSLEEPVAPVPSRRPAIDVEAVLNDGGPSQTGVTGREPVAAAQRLADDSWTPDPAWLPPSLKRPPSIFAEESPPVVIPEAIVAVGYGDRETAAPLVDRTAQLGNGAAAHVTDQSDEPQDLSADHMTDDLVANGNKPGITVAGAAVAADRRQRPRS